MINKCKLKFRLDYTWCIYILNIYYFYGKNGKILISIIQK